MCEAVKKLNALKHQKTSRQKKLELLQTEYNQLITDAEEVSNTDAGESAEAQVLNKTITSDRYIISAGNNCWSSGQLLKLFNCNFIVWSKSMSVHQ